MKVDIASVLAQIAAHGLTLAGADRMLDDARRIVWTVNFLGGTWESAAVAGGASAAALEVARIFEGRRLTAINAVLEEVRFYIWTSQAGSMPETRFSNQVKTGAAFDGSARASGAVN